MTDIYTTALKITQIKNRIDETEAALRICEAEDEMVLDLNLDTYLDDLDAALAKFDTLAADAPAATVRHLRHAIKHYKIESLISQMAHL